MHCVRFVLALSLAGGLSGCATTDSGALSGASTSEFGAYAPPLVPPTVDVAENAPANPVSAPTSSLPVPGVNAWNHYKLPGKKPTQFQTAKLDGRKSVRVSAQGSASMLRYKLRVAPQNLAALKFSWKVPSLIEGADFSVRELDDSPVRVVLAFEGDYAKFSAGNAMLSELSRSITGEPLPYATLMYVWSNQGAPESVVHNPRTDRIRKLVVESGGKNLNQWLDYERDIRADFMKAFGEEPGALVGVALMTDTDNTRSTATAWYGPVSLQPASRVAATAKP